MAARVIRLYRNATGWSWWLQFGCWVEGYGIMSQMYVASARDRFVVRDEYPYSTREEAEKAMAGWCRCPGKCRVHDEK